MVRKYLLAASIALLAIGAAGRPAAAAPVFLEPYPDLFQARTFLLSPDDDRPIDALQGQRSAVDDPYGRFLISPFFRVFQLPLRGPKADVTMLGGSLGYTNMFLADHPASIVFSYFNARADIGGTTSHIDGYDMEAKFVVWQPRSTWLPVASVVGRYQSAQHAGNRLDVLLAVDEKISDKVYLTGNVGYATTEIAGGGGGDDITGGVGLTYAITSRLSLSGDFTFNNRADYFYGLGGDWWGLAATWAVDRTSSIRFGGGKGNSWFANYIAKFDW